MEPQKQAERDVSRRSRIEEAAVADDMVAETERLLSGRKRDIKLSGRMLDLHRLQSWRQRSAVVRSWMVWVACVSLIMSVFNVLLIPQAVWIGALITGLMIPALNAAVHFLWLRPRSAAIEGLSIVIWTSATMTLVAALGAIAGGFAMERYLTGGLFIATVGLIVLGVELVWTIVAATVVVTLAFFVHVANPTLPFAQALALTLLYGLGIFATVVARKTMTIVAQHSFLMTLRDGHRRRELAEANVRLAQLATTDALTGIANRRSAGDTIRQFWDDVSVDKAAIAFLMVDIDHFKRLNDSRGHAAGDACIQAVATTIATSVRARTDIVSRYGGEEFLIVLTKANRAIAVDIAERIRRAVANLGIPNPMSATAPTVTVSLGIAMATADGLPEIVAKWADEALYEAKRQGRNRACVHSQPASPALPSIAAPSLSDEWDRTGPALAAAG